MDNIIYMRKYINQIEYDNLNNSNKSIFLKRKIKLNNKKYLQEICNNNFKINNIELDSDQKKCIFTNEINTLVLSSAGSGKTFTIVGKVDYLINKENIDPKEILCLSFTNEAVNNLRSRIPYNIDIFTFHKLSLSILDDYKYYYNIVSSDYLSYIINEIFYSICINIDEKILLNINKEITNFINLLKTYNYDYNYLKRIIKKNKSKMLLVIEKIYLIYIEELLSTNSIDFSDMISISTRLIREKGLKRYYKYIIIDEFQDISYNEFLLIKEIQRSCDSFVFCVGDDFQSIYKFAGSNIDLIRNFKKYFSKPLILRINNTYRNSNELIKTASKFIMKNKYQIRKRIRSDITLYKPIKIIYYRKNMSLLLERLLNKYDSKYMILSRNTFDIKYIINDNISYKDGMVLYKDKEYRYLTIHKSKGLEEDNVIILNLSNNMYGFPSKKEDNLTKLIYKKDKYLYEEERRLFYVALTRTKNYVYLFVDKDNPSIFVKEIINYSKKNIEVLNL